MCILLCHTSSNLFFGEAQISKDKLCKKKNINVPQKTSQTDIILFKLLCQEVTNLCPNREVRIQNAAGSLTGLSAKFVG